VLCPLLEYVVGSLLVEHSQEIVERNCVLLFGNIPHELLGLLLVDLNAHTVHYHLGVLRADLSLVVLVPLSKYIINLLSVRVLSLDNLLDILHFL